MRLLTILSIFLLAMNACPDSGFAKAQIIRTYYPSGATKAEFFKENGKLNGPVKWYYQDGALGALLTYRENQLHGLSQTFYQSGQVKKQVLMKQNKPVGLTHYYKPDGSLEKIEVLQSGEAKTQWTAGEGEEIIHCEDIGKYDQE